MLIKATVRHLDSFLYSAKVNLSLLGVTREESHGMVKEEEKGKICFLPVGNLHGERDEGG